MFFFLQSLTCTDTDYTCQMNTFNQEYGVSTNSLQNAYPNFLITTLTTIEIGSCIALMIMNKPCLSVSYIATVAGCLSITLGEIIELVRLNNKLNELKTHFAGELEKPAKERKSPQILSLESAISSKTRIQEYFKNKIVYYSIASAAFSLAVSAPLLNPSEPSITCSIASNTRFSFFSQAYADEDNSLFQSLGGMSGVISTFKLASKLPTLKATIKAQVTSAPTRLILSSALLAGSIFSSSRFNHYRNKASEEIVPLQSKLSELNLQTGTTLCNNLPCDLLSSNEKISMPKISPLDSNIAFDEKSKDQINKLFNQEIHPSDVDLSAFKSLVNSSNVDFKKTLEGQKKVFNDFTDMPTSGSSGSSSSQEEIFSLNTEEIPQINTISSSSSLRTTSSLRPISSKKDSIFSLISTKIRTVFQKTQSK